MRDGSDAVSDWPLLNALLNCASGATWVSLHHGGGVGMGFSQHSGMVICCDGTRGGRRPPRPRALERPGDRRDAPRRRRLRDRARLRPRARAEAARHPLTTRPSNKESHMSLQTSFKAALLGLAALGLTGVAASADQLADIKAAGKIVTATDMHYAPFDMLIDGVYQGMTKDLFDEVAKEIGVEPVYQDLPWTAQLPGLEVGKFDIVIAPVTITPERLERYTFTLPIADATVGPGQGRLQRRDPEARGHQGQDRRRPAGHGAVPRSSRPSARSSAASTSRNTARPTRPMPTSPSAGSTPWPAPRRTSPTSSSSAATPSRCSSPRPSASRSTSPGCCRRTRTARASLRRSTTRMLKMTDDGRVKAIQEKWLGSYTELPREVPAS